MTLYQLITTLGLLNLPECGATVIRACAAGRRRPRVGSTNGASASAVGPRRAGRARRGAVLGARRRRSPGGLGRAQQMGIGATGSARRPRRGRPEIKEEAESRPLDTLQPFGVLRALLGAERFSVQPAVTPYGEGVGVVPRVLPPSWPTRSISRNPGNASSHPARSRCGSGWRP